MRGWVHIRDLALMLTIYVCMVHIRDLALMLTIYVCIYNILSHSRTALTRSTSVLQDLCLDHSISFCPGAKVQIPAI